MKTWYFNAQFLVTRECMIEAEDEREAMIKWKNNEFDDGHDIDCSLQDVEEPNWGSPDEDDSEPSDEDDEDMDEGQ